MDDIILPQKKPGQQPPESPGFLTPDAIAAQEEQQPHSVISDDLSGRYRPPQKTRWWKRLSKKQWIIIGVVLALLLSGGGYAWWKISHKSKPAATKQPTKQAALQPTPQPTTVASNLTGVQVDPAINQRPITAIMIENSPDARPQSGIIYAGVVFEAIAEGGITRFLTLFQDSEPDYIGPVRSVRPYYIQWLSGFNASVAHVGGSADALNKLKQWGIKDLDQSFNPGAFWRISSRFAPHNVYTSIAKLRELQVQKGFMQSTYTGFPRKTDAPSVTPTARSIDFNISGALYNPHFDYDRATNSYKRSEGGKPHVDEKTNIQITPKVVVGLVLQQGNAGIYTTYETIGSGQAFIFQDGVVTPATWRKTANEQQFTFSDPSGAPIKFNPDQTWISAVGGADRIGFQP